MLDIISGIIRNFRIADAVDIAIVAFLVYKVLGFIRETRAQQLVRGILVFVTIFFISDLFDLYLLNYLMKSLFTLGIFALVVLFQPELRRGLEQMGRKNLVRSQFKSIEKEQAVKTVNNIVTALDDMSRTRTGALIAIERDTMLNDILETGTVINADSSSRLIENIFYEGSPLHDGGMIIRGSRLHAASCVFPLTKNKIGVNLGTRHKAGVGLSEVSDALVIIVSEETGVISIAENGSLRRFLDYKTLEKILLNIYMPEEPKKVLDKVSDVFNIKGGRGDENK